jgi:hypothetical protein
LIGTANVTGFEIKDWEATSDRQSALKVVVTLSPGLFQTNSATTPVNVLRHSYSSGL